MKLPILYKLQDKNTILYWEVKTHETNTHTSIVQSYGEYGMDPYGYIEFIRPTEGNSFTPTQIADAQALNYWKQKQESENYISLETLQVEWFESGNKWIFNKRVYSSFRQALLKALKYTSLLTTTTTTIA
jgi:hypothetical protein